MAKVKIENDGNKIVSDSIDFGRNPDGSYTARFYIPDESSQMRVSGGGQNHTEEFNPTATVTFYPDGKMVTTTNGVRPVRSAEHISHGDPHQLQALIAKFEAARKQPELQDEQTVPLKDAAIRTVGIGTLREAIGDGMIVKPQGATLIAPAALEAHGDMVVRHGDTTILYLNEDVTQRGDEHKQYVIEYNSKGIVYAGIADPHRVPAKESAESVHYNTLFRQALPEAVADINQRWPDKKMAADTLQAVGQEVRYEDVTASFTPEKLRLFSKLVQGHVGNAQFFALGNVPELTTAFESKTYDTASTQVAAKAALPVVKDDKSSEYTVEQPFSPLSGGALLGDGVKVTYDKQGDYQIAYNYVTKDGGKETLRFTLLPGQTYVRPEHTGMEDGLFLTGDVSDDQIAALKKTCDAMLKPNAKHEITVKAVPAAAMDALRAQVQGAIGINRLRALAGDGLDATQNGSITTPDSAADQPLSWNNHDYSRYQDLAILNQGKAFQMHVDGPGHSHFEVDVNADGTPGRVEGFGNNHLLKAADYKALAAAYAQFKANDGFLDIKEIGQLQHMASDDIARNSVMSNLMQPKERGK